EPVVRELALVEEVAELLVELRVLVVRDLDRAVLDAEGVPVILAQRIALDLGGPALEVLAVEQRHPAGVLCDLVAERGGSSKEEQTQDDRAGRIARHGRSLLGSRGVMCWSFRRG